MLLASLPPGTRSVRSTARETTATPVESSSLRAPGFIFSRSLQEEAFLLGHALLAAQGTVPASSKEMCKSKIQVDT